ncbi:MAG: DNA-binding protein [Actinobacteria bacterium]|uniref:Unannotated protein n=1 Tax=freshwater metagenome TaxID=449393 RepID=A0A6J7S4C4_9ZZZZ|nr:DNA-binding protein [Actinomycetota bacterium]
MVAKKTAAKAPAKKAAPTKKAAPAAAVKKVVTAPVKKAAAAKVAPKKAGAKVTPVKKVVAKAAPVKPAVKAVVKPAVKSVVKPAAKAAAKPASKPAAKAVAKKVAPAKAVAKKVVAQPAAKAPVGKAAAKKAQPAPKIVEVVVDVVVEEPVKPVAKRIVPTISANKPKKLLAPNGKPLVREDESPWTPAELKEVRASLKQDITRLEAELVNAEIGLADLIRDSGDGAGDDQADAGSKTFEREHEMSLANNAREMLQQVNHAIARLDDGTYGACEVCGKPIGKYRLQAFPRATLCLVCKQAEERMML